MPWELGFTSSTTGKWSDESDKLVNLDTMLCPETALGKVSLLPKAQYVPGKRVHVHGDYLRWTMLQRRVY